MAFSRPGVSYGKPPEPTTPYQRAAQVWDDRIGSARVQARNWRIMAFGCLLLAVGSAGALVWEASQSRIAPYVVEVNALGEVKAVGPAERTYTPNDAQIAHHLARFVRNVRALPTDAVVLRQQWLDAYDYVEGRAATTLSEHARAADPFSKVGRLSAAVEVTSVVRASPNSFQVRWAERLFENGSALATERWTAILSVALDPPRTDEQVRKNPLGVYVTSLAWNRELEAAPAPVRPPT